MLGEGDKAADFSLESTDGTFTLSDAVRRSPVLLYFFPVIHGKTCTEYIALMNERTDEFRKLGVNVVHINSEAIDSHRSWIEHTGSGFAGVSDPNMEACRKYDAVIERAKSESMIGRTNRAFFLIDGTMTVRYAWRAYMPTDTVPMDELLKTVGKLV